MSGRSALLTWNANLDNPTGYRIHFGTISGIYSQSVDVGNVTTYTLIYPFTGVIPPIFDWPADTKWYFVVMAYNSAGESPASNEVYKAIAPYRLSAARMRG